MTREKFLSTLKGILAFAQLKEEDAFLLCLLSKKQNIFIPFLRKKGIGSAYINPDVYDDAQYENICNIIDFLNKEKIFTSIKYTPKYMKAPEYVKEVCDFVRPTGVEFKLPFGIKESLEKAGFTLNICLGGDYPYTPRDYGDQVESNPDFKIQFEAEMNKLKKANVSYDNLPTEVKINYEAVASGAKDGIIFVGPTGTGKTWLTMALACQAHAHREDIQITPDTQVEDLIGKYVADDRPNAESHWRFVEGPLLKSFYRGYAISIQEINYGIAGVNSCLNRYLDGTLQIEENGKIYHRHPNFVAYLTMNPGYEGTETLNMALKNRFSIIQIPEWTTEKYCEVLGDYSEKLGHRLSERFFKELITFASTIEKDAGTSRWHENVKYSVRNAQRLLDTILLKPRTFEEFTLAIHSEYINLLSCDNNNSDKLEKYKKDESIVNSIKKMYEMYDFSEIAEAKSNVDDFDELFAAEEEEEEATSDSREEAFGKIMDRFGLDK